MPFRITGEGVVMQSRNAAFVLLLVILFWPVRSEAQVQPTERHKAVSLGIMSGTLLGAAGGGLMSHHICANNSPAFGMLCPAGVVTLLAGAGGFEGILTGLVVGPTVHGSKWKSVLKGAVIGTVMGGVLAKTGGAHGKQIGWALLGSAAHGAGTSAIIMTRMR